MLVLGKKDLLSQLEAIYPLCKFKREYRENVRETIINYIKFRVNEFIESSNLEGMALYESINHYCSENFYFKDGLGRISLDTVYAVRYSFVERHIEDILSIINPSFYKLLTEPKSIQDENIDESFRCLAFLASKILFSSYKSSEMPESFEGVKRILEPSLEREIPDSFEFIFNTPEKCKNLLFPLISVDAILGDKKYAIRKTYPIWTIRTNAYVKEVVNLRDKIVNKKSDFVFTDEDKISLMQTCNRTGSYHSFYRDFFVQDMIPFFEFLFNNINYKRLF